MSKPQRGGAPLMLGYTRVGTEEQANSGNGLQAQRAAIDAEAERRGWAVEHYADEGVSGKVIGPRLLEVLQLLASGQADGLVVSKLDRLSRSIINAATTIENAQKQGWSLVVLDMDLDLTTAAGRMVAGQLILFAQYERELIGERTKGPRRQTPARGGTRTAEPGCGYRATADRADRDSGLSFEEIARRLTSDEILSPGGLSTWQSSTVRRVYRSAKAKERATAVSKKVTA